MREFFVSTLPEFLKICRRWSDNFQTLLKIPEDVSMISVVAKCFEAQNLGTTFKLVI